MKFQQDFNIFRPKLHYTYNVKTYSLKSRDLKCVSSCILPSVLLHTSCVDEFQTEGHVMLQDCRLRAPQCISLSVALETFVTAVHRSGQTADIKTLQPFGVTVNPAGADFSDLQ